MLIVKFVKKTEICVVIYFCRFYQLLIQLKQVDLNFVKQYECHSNKKTLYLTTCCHFYHRIIIHIVGCSCLHLLQQSQNLLNYATPLLKEWKEKAVGIYLFIPRTVAIFMIAIFICMGFIAN